MKHKQLMCAMCGNPENWYEVMRVGGLVEQITGKKFVCRACAEDLQAGKIGLRLGLARRSGR